MSLTDVEDFDNGTRCLASRVGRVEPQPEKNYAVFILPRYFTRALLKDPLARVSSIGIPLMISSETQTNMALVAPDSVQSIEQIIYNDMNLQVAI